MVPNFILSRLKFSPELKKIADNIGWLFCDKFLRMGIGLVVGIWIARYLGPELFGMLNFSMAFVALFSSVAVLGLDGVVVRDIVKEPENATQILRAALALRILSGIGSSALAVGVISCLRPEDSLIKVMVAILSLVLVLRATEVVKYWYESQVLSKYAVWVESGVFLVISLVRLGLLLHEAPLIAFVWAAVAESALVAVGFLLTYVWQGGILLEWQLHISRVRQLLKDSWPLMLSGLAIMVYMRIDQIMLGQMINDEAVGIYAAAIRISEVWYFIPGAIASSVFPTIVASKNESIEVYHQRLQKLYDIMVIVAVLVALPMTFLSGWLIELLYGSSYKSAGTILSIHIWVGIFVALSISSGKWFVNENLSHLALKRNFYGMVLNVVLNILLIPTYGPAGAAIATVFSYAMSALVSDALSSQTRFMFYQKVKSLFFVNFFRCICMKVKGR